MEDPKKPDQSPKGGAKNEQPRNTDANNRQKEDAERAETSANPRSLPDIEKWRAKCKAAAVNMGTGSFVPIYDLLEQERQEKKAARKP